MTASVIPWLPKDAFTEESVKAVLVGPLACWSERWFARGVVAVSAVRMVDDKPQLAQGFCAEGLVVDAELSGHGKRHLLEAALDIELSGQTLGEGDYQLLDALATQVVGDLITAMDKLLGATGAQKSPARVSVSLSLSGIELLLLLLPSHALVPLFKAQLGGARVPNEAPQSRMEALKPVHLVAEGILGRADLALADLSGLAIGDVVILDRSLHEPVEVRLSGTHQKIGSGKLGRSGNQVSIHF